MKTIRTRIALTLTALVALATVAPNIARAQTIINGTFTGSNGSNGTNSTTRNGNPGSPGNDAFFILDGGSYRVTGGTFTGGTGGAGGSTPASGFFGGLGGSGGAGLSVSSNSTLSIEGGLFIGGNGGSGGNTTGSNTVGGSGGSSGLAVFVGTGSQVSVRGGTFQRGNGGRGGDATGSNGFGGSGGFTYFAFDVANTGTVMDFFGGTVLAGTPGAGGTGTSSNGVTDNTTRDFLVRNGARVNFHAPDYTYTAIDANEGTVSGTFNGEFKEFTVLLLEGGTVAQGFAIIPEASSLALLVPALGVLGAVVAARKRK